MCSEKYLYCTAPLPLRFGAFMGRRLNFSAGREYAPATGPGRVTTISLPNREESHRGMPADCSDNSRFAGRCIVCRGEEGTKHRVILLAPMGVMRLCLLRLGTTLPSPQEGREDRDVWTLGAAMRSLQGRAATLRHNSGLDEQHNTAYREGCHSTRPSAAARGP